MNFYQQQFLEIRKKIFPEDHWCQQIERSKFFIDNHFSKNITLNDIAGEAFFSRFHFIRLFKKYYGRPPYQYLREVRIAKAKEFLRKGIPVTDVCFAVGFESPTSFTGLFRKYTGLSPSSYQKAKKKQS